MPANDGRHHIRSHHATRTALSAGAAIIVLALTACGSAAGTTSSIPR